MGARQSEADSELAFELLTEGPEGCVGSDGNPTVKGKGISVPDERVMMKHHEIEWYRVKIILQ